MNKILPEENMIKEMNTFFNGISDFTRLKILLALIDNELCVFELEEIIGMSKSAISHQLRYLKNLHMVKCRKSGKNVIYSLDDDHVKEIIGVAFEHLSHVKEEK